MDALEKSTNIKTAQDIFNILVKSVRQSQWIFNDNSDSILTFDPPTNQDSTTWKPNQIRGNAKNFTNIKENLVSQLTTLNNIIGKDSTSNSRYSKAFEQKVSNALSHVNFLNRYR